MTIKCPKCGSNYYKMIDSRQRRRGWVRTRECDDCGYRYRTVEILDSRGFLTPQDYYEARDKAEAERNLFMTERIERMAKKLNVTLLG